MKVVARNYDRDDFIIKTALEVEPGELVKVLRAVRRLLGVHEFEVHHIVRERDSKDYFIISYDDNRSFKAGKIFKPEISEHRDELEEILTDRSL